MIKVSEQALHQAINEYLAGPKADEVIGQWIDRLIFQIDDSNEPLAQHFRHLIHIIKERHAGVPPECSKWNLDVLMIAVWTIFRAEVLTGQEDQELRIAERL